MFDIGPAELILISVVALLVIGPEKLPSAIRTGSLWVGRFRSSFYKIKAEVEKELNADEIKRQLHNESILEEVKNAKSKVENFTRDIKSAASDTDNDDETDLRLTPNSDGKKSDQKPSENPDESDKERKAKEGTITGELKQAVSYVNDITREVKSNTQEIKTELNKSDAREKPKAGEEK